MGRTSHTSCATQLVFMEKKIEELEAENQRLRQALEVIMAHQKKVSPTLSVHSASYHIAKAALEVSDE